MSEVPLYWTIKRIGRIIRSGKVVLAFGSQDDADFSIKAMLTL